MKAVDITLLIQVFNFFVAYTILRKYVFIPSIKILKEEEAQDHTLQKLINDSLEEKNKAEEQMELRSLAMKHLLQKAIPLQEQELHKDTVQAKDMMHEKILLSQKERDTIKKVIEDGISEVTL